MILKNLRYRGEKNEAATNSTVEEAIISKQENQEQDDPTFAEDPLDLIWKTESLLAFDLKGVGKNRRLDVLATDAGLPLSSTIDSGATVGPNLGGPSLGVGGLLTSAAMISALSETNPQPSKPRGRTLWDQNFREWIKGMPICLRKHDMDYLQRALWNDTWFLLKMQLMDYSLLLLIGRESRRIQMGLIDYVRPYTLDKQVESMVKMAVSYPQGLTPSVIDPQHYAERLLKMIQKSFMQRLPDFDVVHLPA
ncbi:unnamed protein product [Amoebophrya sp. A25]|nr:unnamed protein product [Amoebophrya sp. A25]|eukprot:GSA25T00025405001.1